LKIDLAFVCCVILIVPEVWAFNLETHALITLEAQKRSVLADTNVDLAQRYGFDRLDPKRTFDNQNTVKCGLTSANSVAYRDGYIDASDAWLKQPGASPRSNVFGRCPTLFEQRSMPPNYTGLLPAAANPVGPTGWLRIEGWLMRGAIREDDYQSGKYDNPILMPDQDPWLDKFRSLHHFYNPINDQTGLPTGTGFFSAPPAQPHGR